MVDAYAVKNQHTPQRGVVKEMSNHPISSYSMCSILGGRSTDSGSTCFVKEIRRLYCSRLFLVGRGRLGVEKSLGKRLKAFMSNRSTGKVESPNNSE